ncbi:hypothetical protein BTN49_0343 (plasmid) [Candidatus Enterovibrio escicola]|uniref:Uncharacterized protein n=1 Tax=Candidatus Enterovibrio escicola TaxID=1927127 RepID=A0A2A5T754_9GAMM|nr:hypothetical protein BTN49_0343 [Candidatus Enterovibrio escacola]
MHLTFYFPMALIDQVAQILNLKYFYQVEYPPRKSELDVDGVQR